MELRKLLDGMNSRLKTDVFQLNEDGSCRISVDGELVVEVLDFPEDGRVLLCANLGQEPIEGKDEFYRLLMRAMFMFRDSLGCTFSLDPDSNCIYLQRADYLDLLDEETFYELFEDFFNLAANWFRLLNDFRPGVEMTAAAVREERTEQRFGSLNGSFIQV